jgi:hypothetical protein
MADVISLQGPVEKVDGRLVLLPLSGGGNQFLDCTKGISELEGEYLKITIPDWLTGMLRIEEGSMGEFAPHAHSELRPFQKGLARPWSRIVLLRLSSRCFIRYGFQATRGGSLVASHLLRPARHHSTRHV